MFQGNNITISASTNSYQKAFCITIYMYQQIVWYYGHKIDARVFFNVS